MLSKFQNFDEVSKFQEFQSFRSFKVSRLVWKFLVSCGVSKFQEFQEFQWLSEFQNFDGVSKFQEFQSFKACLEILGKFRSFEVSRVSEVSMAFRVSNLDGVSRHI